METSRLPATFAWQTWLVVDSEATFCMARLPLIVVPGPIENAEPPWMDIFPVTVAFVRARFPPFTETFPETPPE